MWYGSFQPQQTSCGGGKRTSYKPETGLGRGDERIPPRKTVCGWGGSQNQKLYIPSSTYTYMRGVCAVCPCVLTGVPFYRACALQSNLSMAGADGCPQCGANELMMQSGCATCPFCGWSACSV